MVLAGFVASCAANGVELRWSLGGEAAVRFLIGRARDGLDEFTQIGSITGTGGSYSFRDESAVATESYRYALDAIERSGARIRLGLISANCAAAAPARPHLAAWPNPFTNRLTMEWTSPAPAAASLSVFDVTGRQIARLALGSIGPGTHHALWDGRSDRGMAAAKGVYYVRLSTSGLPDEVVRVVRR